MSLSYRCSLASCVVVLARRTKVCHATGALPSDCRLRIATTATLWDSPKMCNTSVSNPILLTWATFVVFVYIFTTSDAPSILLGDVPAWSVRKTYPVSFFFFFCALELTFFFFFWEKLCIDERKRKPLRERECLRNTLFYFWSRALFTKPHRAHQPPASCVVVNPPITETAFCQFVL